MKRNLFFIRISLALTILAAALIGAPVAAQGATTVRIDPAATSAQVNDRVNLSVKIDNVANFTAFEIHLMFDPNVLEVVEVTNGGFVAADFPVQNVFDNAAGTIDYAVAQMNRAPAQGSGALLNIAFRAKSNGSATVALRATQAAPSGLLLSDQNGAAIQSAWVNGSVNVGSGPTVTPPTATPPTATPPTATPPTATPPTATPPTATPPTATPPTATPPTATPPATTFPQTAAAVRMDPAAISVKGNDAFNLFVKVDNAANLSAFELHLAFDAKVLEVKELINGGFVAADIVAQNKFDNAAGTIDYTIAQNGRPASQGSGTLLTVVFRAKPVNGSSRVDLRAMPSAPTGLLLSNLNGMVLPSNWTGGSVTVSQVTPQPRIHTVRWGEWLYCIGRAYGVSPWAIADANGINWWPYMIYPGQQLSIPNVAWVDMPQSGSSCSPQFSTAAQAPVVTSTPAPVVTVVVVTVAPPTAIPPTATPAPVSSCRAIYVVRPGDTLYRIGLAYGVSYAEIARVNQIANVRLIYSGQQLCIP